MYRVLGRIIYYEIRIFSWNLRIWNIQRVLQEFMADASTSWLVIRVFNPKMGMKQIYAGIKLVNFVDLREMVLCSTYFPTTIIQVDTFADFPKLTEPSLPFSIGDKLYKAKNLSDIPTKLIKQCPMPPMSCVKIGGKTSNSFPTF